MTTGDGADTVLGVEHAIGSNHNDSIAGSDADNAIAGGLGSDTIASFSGEDQISGEAGNDILFGDEDDDDIYGGSGDDRLNGGPGTNVCDGGSGNNVFLDGCDGSAPVLTELAISPDSVDTFGESQTVSFDLSVTDAAGVDPTRSRVIVHAPAGSPSFDAELQLDGERLQGRDHPAAVLGPGHLDGGGPARRPGGQPGPPDDGRSCDRRASEQLRADRRRRHRRPDPGPGQLHPLAGDDRHLRRRPHGHLRVHRDRRPRGNRPCHVDGDRPRARRPAELRGAAGARRRHTDQRHLPGHRDDPALLGPRDLDDRAAAGRRRRERDAGHEHRPRRSGHLHPDRRRRHDRAGTDGVQPLPGSDQHLGGRSERQLQPQRDRRALGGRPGRLQGDRPRPGEPAARRERTHASQRHASTTAATRRASRSRRGPPPGPGRSRSCSSTRSAT